jgi:type IV fimbrial biogenesis protein FimT
MSSASTEILMGSTPRIPTATHSVRPLVSWAQRGLSLIEAMATLAVLGLSLTLATPSMLAWQDAHRVRALAAQVETDVQLARSLAVARQQNVRLSVWAGAGGGCYVVHTGPASACSCTAAGPQCQPGAELLRAMALPAQSSVTFNASVGSMVFDADRGTVTPAGTVRVVGAGGAAVHQVVNVMGRVRSCAPGASRLGLPTC